MIASIPPTTLTHNASGVGAHAWLSSAGGGHMFLIQWHLYWFMFRPTASLCVFSFLLQARENCSMNFLWCFVPLSGDMAVVDFSHDWHHYPAYQHLFRHIKIQHRGFISLSSFIYLLQIISLWLLSLFMGLVLVCMPVPTSELCALQLKSSSQANCWLCAVTLRLFFWHALINISQQAPWTPTSWDH